MTPLFRGEGRLKPWSCTDHQQLREHFRTHGFAPRAPELQFTGAIPEQILHQGYVDQGTVSLTASWDIAASYATAGKQPNTLGVVFTIDRERLRRSGEIYDSYASMRSSLDWFFESDFETVSRLVTLLDAAAAGEFLDWCDRDTRDLVQRGLDAFTPEPDWSRYPWPSGLDDLIREGIEAEQLASLHHAFRSFWMHAFGQIGATDTLLLDSAGGAPQVRTKRAGPLAYYHAFRMVKSRLLEVQMQAQLTEAHKRSPGWQTTPFGYVAKTCRDQEFFSTGPIPGYCLIDATIVACDEKGRLSVVK